MMVVVVVVKRRMKRTCRDAGSRWMQVRPCLNALDQFERRVV